MPVEGEVPEAGDEDAHGDEADAEGEEDGGEGLPQHHHGQHEVDEGRAALDGAVHRDVHPVQRDQGQSTGGEVILRSRGNPHITRSLAYLFKNHLRYH